MTIKLFGTDGIRGCAGEFPLNRPAIVAIGRAVAERLGGKVLIGQDTRVSSPWIFELLQKGFAHTPATLQNAGVIPTPAIALLTKWLGYSGGLMISASHNPYQDNGIKVFGADGTKLNDVEESHIEKRIHELLGDEDVRGKTDTVPGWQITASNTTGWNERYQEILLSHFPNSDWLRGLRIVVDCANGAMSEIAPRLLTKLGADVVVTHASPNGSNINDGCGAVHAEALRTSMRAVKADFGVAFDGDGDRSMFMSGNGRLIDGDAVLLLMARRLKKTGSAESTDGRGNTDDELQSGADASRRRDDTDTSWRRRSFHLRRNAAQRQSAWRRAFRARDLFGFQTIGRRVADDVESGGSDRSRSRFV